MLCCLPSFLLAIVIDISVGGQLMGRFDKISSKLIAKCVITLKDNEFLESLIVFAE